MADNKNAVPVALAICFVLVVAFLAVICILIYKMKVPNIPAPVNNVYVITGTGNKDSVKVVSVPVPPSSNKCRSCSHIINKNDNNQVLYINTKDSVDVRVISPK